MTTASLTEGKHTGEFLISEANGEGSRDTVTVTVPAATKFVPGRVLAKVSADGKHVEYDNTGSDGSEEAAAVLYAELDNSAGQAPADLTGVVINWSAEVRAADLVWKSSLQTADKTQGLADLRQVGIKAR